MDANTGTGVKTPTLSASRRLLEPVVRLLLRSGITWKEFAEVAKTAFVQVATDEYGIRGRPTNLARVAILTGINRREVARQRQLTESDQPAQPVFMNAAQRLLSPGTGTRITSTRRVTARGAGGRSAAIVCGPL